MSKSDRQSFSIGRPLHVVCGEGVTLEDFLYEGDFVDIMGVTRWRLIRVFATARTAPKRRATPGYILGLDDKLSNLAAYVQKSMSGAMQEKVYSTNDLPLQYQQLDAYRRERIVNAVRYELFVRLLELMQESHQLWRMENEWSVPQSVIDEYLLMTKRARANFRNDRSFHGRPRRDRKRLNQLRIAGGVSTGM